MKTPSLGAAAYKAIYDEMRSGVARQEAALEAVRSAAARALGIGVIASSVIGSAGSIAGEGLACWTWAVVVPLLLVLVILTAAIWWPRRGWRFAVGAKKAIKMLERMPTPPPKATIYRQRAIDLEEDFDTNEQMLRSLQFTLQVLLGSLVVLVLTLVLMLVIPA